jgi:predicted PhzF superfamily epimerase YddE/YHI9
MIALIRQLKATNTLARLNQIDRQAHLSHADLHKRDQYMAKLVAIGPPAVLPVLRQLAKTGEANPTHPLCTVIQEMGDTAVPELERAMHHSDIHLRHHAIALLGCVATPAAMHALDDESVDLVDRDAIEAARTAARHHDHAPGQTL